MKSALLLIIFLVSSACLKIKGQIPDSLKMMPGEKEILASKKDGPCLTINRPLYRQMIIPAVLTSYGFIALNNTALSALDNHIKEEVWTKHLHPTLVVDDYLQYLPGLSVYGLNVLGIKGKNNFRDRTTLYLLSSVLMTITVQSIKGISRQLRPDSIGNNSFPSGHTATAFVGAEFLNQEYKDRSPLYGIAGYSLAAIVGYMRIYNNRHWFKDVVAGAGIGMGITKFIYWLYPRVKQKFFGNKYSRTRLNTLY